MSEPLIIEGIRAIDPGLGLDEEVVLVLSDGIIHSIGLATTPGKGVRWNGKGLWLLPGLVDMHVHFRDPGFVHKEDLRSGARAAAAGGFTSVLCMPNTKPPMDTPERFLAWKHRMGSISNVRLLQAGCLTRDSLGKELVDFEGLAGAGAVAFTDDGRCPQEELVMERCLRQATAWRPILQHPEDLGLSKGGVIHEGKVARSLGVKGIPRESEIRIVRRDLNLVRKTKARLHLQHLSCKESVEEVYRAKAEGLPVTCEVCPHHLVLTEDSCRQGDPVYKVNPPLREEEDRVALLDAVCDGTVDAIATDHAPHTDLEKGSGLIEAPFGVVGLESALPILMTELVYKGIILPSKLVSLLSGGPASILGLDCGGLRPGKPADLTLVDPNLVYELNPSQWFSKARNCPFAGRKVRGRVLNTICGGRVVYGSPLR